MKFFYVFSMMAIFLLSGCSNIKPYTNDMRKNLTVNTSTDSGSFFSSVNAYIDIYSVDSNCKGSYVGTVNLNKDSREVGIKENAVSLLSFRFTSSTFMGGTSSSTNYNTLLKPRRGYQYLATASYADDIYYVEVREKKSAADKGKELQQRELNECQKL